MGAPNKGLDAVIPEAVFSDVRKAIDNRVKLRLGEFGTLLSPLLTVQIGPRLGLDESDLSPKEKIGELGCPVFIISGEEDKRTTPKDTLELFESAKEPKQIWLVPEAKHVGMHKFIGQEYETRVLEFLEKNLRK